LARIAGVDLPKTKRVVVGLTYIYGIGRPLAEKICADSKVDVETRVSNLTEEEAAEMWDNFVCGLGSQVFPMDQQFEKKVLSFPKNQGPYMLVENTDMQGHAALLLIDEGAFSFEKGASQQILSKAFGEAFFKTLRTKQQTAYIAQSWGQDIESELFQFFGVQSSTHQPSELIARFELFLEDYTKDFHINLPEDRFDEIRDTLISSYEKPPTNLRGMAARLNALAFEYNGDFDRIQKRIDALRSLDYADFKETALSFISRKNNRRLALLIEGASPKDKNFKYEVTTAEAIKDSGTYITWDSQ